MIAPESASKLHARYVLSPWSVQGGLDMPVIDRGEGVYVFDDEGRRYLDLASGLVAANLGHAHPSMVAAIADQAARIAFAPPGLFNTNRALLGEELAHLSPWNGAARAYFTPAGAEANEDAMKMARAITGRHKILSAFRSFHGSAHGAGTLTGENRRWPNEPAGIPGVVHFFAPNPYRSPFFTHEPRVECERALAHVEQVMQYENPASIAALVIEPVVGSNGTIVYPDGYLAGLRSLCDRYGIVLVFDEVMTGFGRTGAAFAAQRFGVVPDMLTFAKGVTSAYVPMGGVLVREELASYFDTHQLGCGHTYSGHALAVGAARAALRAYREGALFERALEIEGWLREGLGALAREHAIVGDVRGVGAFFGLELVKDRTTREPFVAWQGASMGPMAGFYKRLRELGVYTFGRYNCVMIAPPLVIERADLDDGLARLGVALGELAA
jgi:taurine--2-oxoglutarate transaminase